MLDKILDQQKHAAENFTEYLILDDGLWVCFACIYICGQTVEDHTYHLHMENVTSLEEIDRGGVYHLEQDVAGGPAVCYKCKKQPPESLRQLVSFLGMKV